VKQTISRLMLINHTTPTATIKTRHYVLLK